MSPAAELGPEEITRFLTSLAVDQNVSSSTPNQALSAILFLYRAVLGADLPWLEDVVRAKRPLHLPIVLGRSEVSDLLHRLAGTHRLMAAAAYGLFSCVIARTVSGIKEPIATRFLVFWRKESGGVWRIVREFLNADA